MEWLDTQKVFQGHYLEAATVFYSFVLLSDQPTDHFYRVVSAGLQFKLSLCESAKQWFRVKTQPEMVLQRSGNKHKSKKHI